MNTQTLAVESSSQTQSKIVDEIRLLNGAHDKLLLVIVINITSLRSVIHNGFEALAQFNPEITKLTH